MNTPRVGVALLVALPLLLLAGSAVVLQSVARSAPTVQVPNLSRGIEGLVVGLLSTLEETLVEAGPGGRQPAQPVVHVFLVYHHRGGAEGQADAIDSISDLPVFEIQPGEPAPALAPPLVVVTRVKAADFGVPVGEALDLVDAGEREALQATQVATLLEVRLTPGSSPRPACRLAATFARRGGGLVSLTHTGRFVAPQELVRLPECDDG